MGSFAIRDLTFSYPEQDRHALDHLTMEINEGDFVAVVGRSGCGKSTLLRHLKSAPTPTAPVKGKFYLTAALSRRSTRAPKPPASAMCFQNPDNQIVTDKVWHELAFGAGKPGLRHRHDSPAGWRRWPASSAFRTGSMRNVYAELSGEAKAAAESGGGHGHAAVRCWCWTSRPPSSTPSPPRSFSPPSPKIHRELGTTVILSEHRLEETFPSADRVAVLDRGGRIAALSTRPRAVGRTQRAARAREGTPPCTWACRRRCASAPG